MIGASYKKNIGDVRESPSLKFFKLFDKNELNFDYHDPYVRNISFENKNNKIQKKKSINLNAKQLKKYDCVIVITNHDKIDYKLIHKNTNLIFDCRSVFKKSKKVIQV